MMHLSGLLAGVVQYHWPGDIEGTCEIIMSQDTDIDGFTEYARRRMGGCWSAEYKYFVEYYSRTQWTTDIMRQWLFQTCNEYGWYQTSGSNNQPFGSSFPVDFYYQWCTDIYDISFYSDSINHNINVTNLNHNGKNPNITNVYSTQGQLDPWRPMGVQEDVNYLAPTVIIPMASHCADFFPIDFYYQWCTDLYDESFYNDSINYNIYVTNLNQNGMNPIITNVYSTHGQLDPWRPMGVQENVNSFAPTAVIPMASHCADLYSISDDDSPEMLASKLRTTSLNKFVSIVWRTLVTEEWIEQKLDNFDDNNNATYQMRYLANAEFYQPGGPIFIYVGGEWSVSPGWITGGHTFDMARELNGYLFYTEHRFYGQSRPTPDLSFENLQYLHVNQALADLAHFIEVKKQEIPGASSSGVILVGASYSATMVTWFRQYYPHLINGAWSSSAPLLAKADFVEYFETVGESIRIVSGDECYNRLDGAFREAERMIEAGEFAALSELFNLCQPLTNNQLDIWNFFSSLSGLLAGVVQYHWPGDIEGTCEIIMSQDTDIDGFAEYARRRMGGCWSAEYEYFVEYYSRTQWTNNIMRQWLFQTCNEYGWYQTSGSNNFCSIHSSVTTLGSILGVGGGGSRCKSSKIFHGLDSTSQIPNVSNRKCKIL
uniref:Uncharacterized protein n=1 Tax=Phlebotomus papatasi TaxID=29031 RepID=A0A1B0DNK3_PHLPP